MRLTKYEALGNDYLVLDLPAPLERVLPLVPALCDRRRGIGADGLLALDAAAARLRVFNPDGSEAEKSGNGLRIAACHAVLEHGFAGSFELRTRDRANQIHILAVEGVRVVSELDLGRARFEPDHEIRLATPAGSVRCRLVDLGNPHCVVLGEPVTPRRCLELGPHLERHPRFPERSNVQLAEAVDARHARAEVWERGAGHTPASGTSAAAVAAALIRLGLAEPALEVLMPGGALTVRQEPDGRLVQSGPARRLFRAEVRLADLCR